MPDLTPQTRARDLLMSVLPAQDCDTFEREGVITVHGSAGGVYQLAIGRSGNVMRFEGGEPTSRLCIHPREPVPDEDTVLAQVLMLWTDEPRFLSLANQTRLGVPATAVQDNPNARLCRTAAEFVEQLVARRQQGHVLLAHDEPYQLLRGFQDNDEWVVIRISALRSITDADAAPLGISGDELRRALGNWREFARLLGQDEVAREHDNEARYMLISESLETPRGRQALAAALFARIRYGGPLPPAVHAEIAHLWGQVRDRSHGDECREIAELRQWVEHGGDTPDLPEDPAAREELMEGVAQALLTQALLDEDQPVPFEVLPRAVGA